VGRGEGGKGRADLHDEACAAGCLVGEGVDAARGVGLLEAAEKFARVDGSADGKLIEHVAGRLSERPHQGCLADAARARDDGQPAARNGGGKRLSKRAGGEG